MTFLHLHLMKAQTQTCTGIRRQLHDYKETHQMKGHMLIHIDKSVYLPIHVVDYQIF